MRKRTIGAIAAVVVVGAGSCALIEQARYVGAEVAGRAVALECALSIDERKANLAAINGWLLANNVTARAIALDCDGDGQSDFPDSTEKN